MEENKTVVAKKHSIVTCERKDIIIEGVIKLDSFDKNSAYATRMENIYYNLMAIIEEM